MIFDRLFDYQDNNIYIYGYHIHIYEYFTPKQQETGEIKKSSEMILHYPQFFAVVNTHVHVCMHIIILT